MSTDGGYIVYNGKADNGNSVCIYETDSYWTVYEICKDGSPIYRGTHNKNFVDKYEAIQLTRDAQKRW